MPGEPTASVMQGSNVPPHPIHGQAIGVLCRDAHWQQSQENLLPDRWAPLGKGVQSAGGRGVQAGLRSEDEGPGRGTGRAHTERGNFIFARKGTNRS